MAIPYELRSMMLAVIEKERKARRLPLHVHRFTEAPFDLRNSRATYRCECGMRCVVLYVGKNVSITRFFPNPNKRGQTGLERVIYGR